jgi:hypothetical protein
MGIEAPLADEIRLNEDETEDEMITNPTDLYNKFQNMVHNESISIGPSGFNNSTSKIK